MSTKHRRTVPSQVGQLQTTRRVSHCRNHNGGEWRRQRGGGLNNRTLRCENTRRLKTITVAVQLTEGSGIPPRYGTLRDRRLLRSVRRRCMDSRVCRSNGSATCCQGLTRVYLENRRDRWTRMKSENDDLSKSSETLRHYTGILWCRGTFSCATVAATSSRDVRDPPPTESTTQPEHHHCMTVTANPSQSNQSSRNSRAVTVALYEGKGLKEAELPAAAWTQRKGGSASWANYISEGTSQMPFKFSARKWYAADCQC